MKGSTLSLEIASSSSTFFEMPKVHNLQAQAPPNTRTAITLVTYNLHLETGVAFRHQQPEYEPADSSRHNIMWKVLKLNLKAQ